MSALESATLRAFEAFARAQGALYLGGDPRAVCEWLTPDVIWHVPGQNAIARDYHGRDAVLEYFVRRRAITGGTTAIIRGERPVSGDVVIQLADGQVERDGERVRWRTAGVYRMDGKRVAEAWLIPLESADFDEIWTALGRHAP